MPRLGDPDADLIRRVLWEIGYIYCIYINRDKTSLFLCSQSSRTLWLATLGGCLFLTSNTIFLVLDKIDSPNARTWSRRRL
ncbi:Os08g0165601 [Oryza sativa Japonica Group]|uniref:Os08g0165601 protein n=1 Tax=Oryza sativa subsp. japonica TaxID=39947 RepID=A0A0P0XCA1_ORYSJ|nr:hypothetical protein EE612_042312 [Oryza sativa]KAF2918257.1 hypothetical protein DAI22_08g044700 [Oryza sativa Japonica Group]BAT03982.1 Os08g0165601 [Oryza sativa Japonica Group]